MKQSQEEYQTELDNAVKLSQDPKRFATDSPDAKAFLEKELNHRLKVDQVKTKLYS